MNSTPSDNESGTLLVNDQESHGSTGKTASAPAKEFKVDLTSISQSVACENANELNELGVEVFRQSDLERGIFQQAEQHIEAEENRLQIQRLKRELQDINQDIDLQNEELRSVATRLAKLDAIASQHSANFVAEERKRLEERRRLITQRLERSHERIDAVQKLLEPDGQNAIPSAIPPYSQRIELDSGEQAGKLSRQLANDADSDEFHGAKSPSSVSGSSAKAPARPLKQLTVDECVNAAQANTKARLFKISKKRWDKLNAIPSTSLTVAVKQPKSDNAHAPRTVATKRTSVDNDDARLVPQHRDRAVKRKAVSRLATRQRSSSEGNDLPFDADKNDNDRDYVASDSTGDDDESDESIDAELGELQDDAAKIDGRHAKRKLHASSSSPRADKKLKKSKRSKSKDDAEHSLVKVVDDADDDTFTKRVRRYKAQLALEQHHRLEAGFEEDLVPEDGIVGGTGSSGGFGGASTLKCPGVLWEKLFRYQKIGVRWLWDLHTHRSGGILGDEMGLGKTIQIIAYFAALHYSQPKDVENNFCGLGPSVIVAPATVLHQWVSEFHRWYPLVRVGVLHATGAHRGDPAKLIRKFASLNSCVLLTTYQGVLSHYKILQSYKWHIVVLDEGHKIRNVDAKVTVACKQLRTPHRIVLSGSPIQNSLKELWSLFDFIFPGKLGTLAVFLEQFAVPITQGGYANATQVQVRTAHKCAVILRDAIAPYLLRRSKAELNDKLKLPGKEEQVLFCRLTPEQREIYKQYLQSDQMQAVTTGRCQIFVGLCALRKICNHPDLFFDTFNSASKSDVEKFGESSNLRDRAELHERSGKFMVVHSLLKLWHKQRHKVLLFSQTVQMLNIIEHYCRLQGYEMLRMDGSTPIKQRQTLVNKFNNDPDIFIFLLTTRVGGVGINLVGANRVIIFDPDWNPSTDMQARERAWRIGQKRDVVIYRLLTTGTVEEKIYHRQIFKQFLTDKVLKDARHTRFFKHNDLHELFVLAPDEADCKITETEALMAGAGAQVNLEAAAKSSSSKSGVTHTHRKSEKKTKKSSHQRFCDVSTSDLKELARELSKKFSAAKEKAEAVDVAPVAGPSSSSNTSAADVDDIDLTIPKHFFHGKRIQYLDRQEAYAEADGADDAALETERARERRRQNDYVLGKLFRNSLVHGALKHDAVVGSAAPDEALVEQEAERVAQQAVKALKESRKAMAGDVLLGRAGASNSSALTEPRQISRAHLGRTALDIVHKDSAQATAAAPPAVVQQKDNAAASSSSSLLLRMQQRNWQPPPPPSSEPSTSTGDAAASSSGDDDEDENDAESRTNVADAAEPGEQQRYHVRPLDTSDPNYVLLMKLRDYIKHGCLGQATTERIVEAFKNEVPQGGAAIFRTLLKKICRFEKRANNVGVWTLKSQYY